MSSDKKLKPETLAISAGRPVPEPDGELNTPIALNSTFHAGGPIGYGRYGNETWSALESAISALEGGETLVFASGQAAASAIFNLLPIGAPVVVSDEGYQGVAALLKGYHESGRLEVRFVEATNTAAVLEAAKGAALLWLESPTNPALEHVDLNTIIAGAKKLGVGVAVDVDPQVTHPKATYQFVQRLRDLPQPIVAMVPGHIHDQALALLQACDIVLATGQDDWATLSFPTSELEEQTYKLARELASKDPLILRFTKKTIQQVASVAWEDILSFTTAQQAEIKSLQAGRPSPRALAIESFLAGKSKPGAGA